MDINYLVDLNNYRSAPKLNYEKRKKLLVELEAKIQNADWITVGIMAFNDYEAIDALKLISKKYPSIKFRGLNTLKGNQKTGNVYIRSENGLGEGILLTCQYNNKILDSSTYGPLPLDFFRS